MYYGTPVNVLSSGSFYPMQIDFVSENTLLNTMGNALVVLLLTVCVNGTS